MTKKKKSPGTSYHIRLPIEIQRWAAQKAATYRSIPAWITETIRQQYLAEKAKEEKKE